MNRSLKLDGGLSTALEGLGINLNTSLWTGELLRSNPKAIERAHRAFIDAGLTSTTNLSLSTKTGTSFKIESSTGSEKVALSGKLLYTSSPTTYLFSNPSK